MTPPTERAPSVEEAVSEKRAVHLIDEERDRQMQKWSSEHDDDHRHGELAIVAARMAVNGTDARVVGGDQQTTWGLLEKHKDDRIRQLVIAGALIAAEIDRYVRQGPVMRSVQVATPAAQPAPTPRMFTLEEILANAGSICTQYERHLEEQGPVAYHIPAMRDAITRALTAEQEPRNDR